MKIKHLNLIKLKNSILAIALALPILSFANEREGNQKDDNKNDNRVEINFKQRHSKTSGSTDNWMADGIKIKRDLSLIEEAREARILGMDEIPADDIYGGIWVNKNVNAYASLNNMPESFEVDLSNFSMPSMGHVTSNFGMRKRRMHYGIDLKVQTGDTIYAAFDGKIRLCQFDRRGYGYYVVIRHTNGLETVYGHLSKFLVKEDQVVRSGEPIALGGNTGRSTGSHLHLEFRFLGKAIDPNKIVDFDNKVCHTDTYLVDAGSFNYKGTSSAVKNYAKSNTTNNKYVAGEVNYHRVKKGDSLSKIAKRYGTTVKSLCRINNISEKTVLRVGQSLRIS